MVVSIALNVIIAVLVLVRQSRIRPVRRQLHLGVPIVLGAIGLVQFLDFTNSHHVSSGTFWSVVAATVLGAGILGVVRALTVRIWTSGAWVVRQGAPITMVLWVLSLALHLTTWVGVSGANASGLETTTFLLYVALTLSAQAYVVNRRAQPLYEALGPDAGQRLKINFGTGPIDLRTFFGGGVPTGGASSATPSYDSSIIDVEVVDDDDPPELRR